MNDLNTGSNGVGTNQRPPKADEQQPGAASAVGFEMPDSGGQATGRSWLPIIAVVIGFWLIWYFAYTVYGFVSYGTSNFKYLLPRALVAGCGAAVSLAIAAVLRLLRGSPMSARALAAIPLSLAATMIHGVVSEEIWLAFKAMDPPTSPLLVMWVTDFVNRFWFFASQSAIILALSYAADVREREERINVLQALAHTAQLRALRNQLNPHFLFNALNSVAGLMSRKRGSEAETMTENLADFLRTTLALDPQKVITLDEEVRLQQLYLDIEKVRFPERLMVGFAIPDELRNALVPSLITQPLIENSIKYAVARSTAPVHVSISAAAQDGRLDLTVEDDGGNAENGSIKGSRTGLSNVAERLQAHYGDRARLVAAAREAGGFRNIVSLPLRFG